MNCKKAKAIRKLVRSLGHKKADLPLHHVSLSNKLVPASHYTAGLRGNVTAIYPKNSFQSVYTNAKRKFKNIQASIIINARAELNLAALGDDARAVPVHG